MNQAEVKIDNEGDVILELPTPPHIWQDESFLSPPKMVLSPLSLSLSSQRCSPGSFDPAPAIYTRYSFALGLTEKIPVHSFPQRTTWKFSYSPLLCKDPLTTRLTTSPPKRIPTFSVKFLRLCMFLRATSMIASAPSAWLKKELKIMNDHF